MALTKIPGELFDADDLDLSDVGTIALDAIKGEADTDTSITFSGSNVITVKANNANQVTFIDGAIVPSTDNDIDLGTSSVEFKDAFFDGTVTSDAFAGPLTGNVTGDVSGSSGSTTGNAATATALQNARTIGGTSFDGTANIAVALAATATALATARTIHGVSFDGTANIDLSEVIADTVGAMVSSNTETNITVSYEDSDNTLDFVIGTLNQNTTGTAANLSGTPNITVGTIGSGNITTTGYLAGPASFTIDPATVGDNTGTVVIAGNLQVDGTTTTINSTTVSIDDLNFSIATDAADSAAANGAGITIGGASATMLYTHATTSFDFNKPVNVTGAFSASGAITGTLGTAAQTNITSLGTLTALTVDNLGVNGNTITANSGALNLTPASGSAIVLDGTINIDAGVVTGATSITSTAFVGGLTGNVTGNASGTAATVTGAAQSAITSLGTLTDLTVDNININGNTIISTDSNGSITLTPNGTGTVGVESHKLHIQGAEGEVASLVLRADESDDAGDDWSIISNTNNTLTIGNDVASAGTDVAHITITPHSTVASSTTAIAGNLTATAGTTTLGHTVIDAENVTLQLKNGNDNYYVWRNLDSGNNLDLRYNSTQLFSYESSTTKWDWRGAHTASETALADGSVTIAANTANNFTIVLEEATTFNAPTSPTNGQIITIEVAQHATSGPYTVTWNTAFEFAASTAPTMTATDAKTDIYTFKYNGTVWQEIGRVQNMAQT